MLTTLFTKEFLGTNTTIDHTSSFDKNVLRGDNLSLNETFNSDFLSSYRPVKRRIFAYKNSIIIHSISDL